MKKEITIIICCYNAAKKICKVFEKIYSQENLEDYVHEVIVVDNHSTDDTKEVINQYQINKDFTVPLHYAYEENPGLSNARKKGINLCVTKWIAFLDDDNLIQSKWITNISKYIELNQNVGAFNGAVIPYVPFKMNQDEQLRLKASLKVLACTHFSMNELRKNKKSPFRNPIGAGMIILTSPLKELSDNGWLNSSGRTKDNLTSGEDGEMAFYVKNKGFEFGFCSDAVLFHEMTRSRLQDEYLNRMWYEIGRGVALVAKKQKTKGMKLKAYKILLHIRLICYFFKNKYKCKYYRKYIEGFFYEI